jgi:hypothetical protein
MEFVMPQTMTQVTTGVASQNNKVYSGPVVPLKNRSNCPSARQLAASIMAGQNFGPILRTLVREGTVRDVDAASKLVDAFVQWYSTGSVTKTKSYVMFEGDVDQVLHAMLLNSKWYMAFCHATTGVYTHHEPIGESGLTVEETADAALFTARLLERTWGADLSPHLQVYVDAVNTGNNNVVSVSCVGNDGPFDIVPIETDVTR